LAMVAAFHGGIPQIERSPELVEGQPEAYRNQGTAP